MKKIHILRNITTLLLLFQVGVIFSQDSLIKNGDYWHYYDAGALNTDWAKITDFEQWKSGESPLGYGDGKIITELYFGKDPHKKHITKYFKKKIFIDSRFVAFEFKIQRDDGAVVFVNGKELFKDNMPNATTNHNTEALNTVKGEGEQIFNQHFFDGSIFKNGENIISVSIHQAYEYSSDCIFSLDLIGYDNPEALSFVIDDKNKSNQKLEQKIKDLSTKFEYEKIGLQKESLESTNYNLKVLIYLLSIFFLLSLIGYYFIILNIKKKNKEKILKYKREYYQRNKKK